MAPQRHITHDQHTVAQFHLRPFVNTNGELFCYRQNQPVKRTSPKPECCEHDFYEFDFNGEKSDNRYDDWLSGIENNAAPRLRSLVSGNPLDRQGCKNWALYVASLFVRSPKYRAQISEAMIQKFRTQTEQPDYILELQHNLFKKGDLVPAEELRKDTERFVRNLESCSAFYHTAGLVRHTASLANVLLTRAWHVVQAPQEKFFLMSDCPVSTAEVMNGVANPGVGFGKEHAFVFVPLTPQHVFIAAPRFARGSNIATPEFVNSMNRLTVRFAHRRVFAHVNSSAIKEFVDREINLLIFGANAFLAA